MRPNGVLSSSATQNMQSSTGQYSTQAGEPAHPVQHSVITASSFGFFLRGVVKPFGLRFRLHFVGNHADGFGGAGCRRHAVIIP